jgi:hypothetical protein
MSENIIDSPKNVEKLEKEQEIFEKERLIKCLLEDFPQCDRLMVESLVEKYMIDGDDKFNEFLLNPPQPIERNTQYIYNGVSVE